MMLVVVCAIDAVAVGAGLRFCGSFCWFRVEMDMEF